MKEEAVMVSDDIPGLSSSYAVTYLKVFFLRFSYVSE